MNNTLFNASTTKSSKIQNALQLMKNVVYIVVENIKRMNCRPALSFNIFGIIAKISLKIINEGYINIEFGFLMLRPSIKTPNSSWNCWSLNFDLLLKSLMAETIGYAISKPPKIVHYPSISIWDDPKVHPWDLWKNICPDSPIVNFR